MRLQDCNASHMPQALRASFAQQSQQQRRRCGRTACYQRPLRRPLGVSALSGASTMQGGMQRDSEGARSTTTREGGELLSRASHAPFSVREAQPQENWDLADMHCSCFYPNAGFLCGPLLRLDRFLSLKVGPRCEVDEWHAFYRCLVAANDLPNSLPKPSTPALVGSAQANGWLQQLSPQQGATELAAHGRSNAQAQGVWGVVQVDSLGGHLPSCISVRAHDEASRKHIANMASKGIAYVSNLAVSSDARRQGVGRALLQSAERVAREWGCLAIALHCNPDNAAAYELYRNAGYEPALVEPMWYSFLQGQSRLDIMTKSLVL